jgi:hypothetical protein
VDSAAREMVLVPSEVSWEFTADRGWTAIMTPPAWWIEQQEELLNDDVSRCAPLRLVPASRRHSHGSPRRGSVAS